MQSGIDSSRLRITQETIMPTKADARAEESTQQAKNTSGEGFFGEDGLSFRDVLDAVNPLNHIPIVSDILANVTGHRPSTASKLAGGAMFGPIGFAASLANVIFESGAGKTPVEAVYAAVSGEYQPTQTARAATTEETDSSHSSWT